MSPAERDPERMHAQIEAWLRTQVEGAEDLTLSDFRSASGGLSSETYFCRASWHEAGQHYDKQLVLRVQPDHNQVVPDPSAMFQFRLMKAMGDHSAVPVPGVWWPEPDGTVIGSPFFFMEEVKGTILLPGAPQPAHPDDVPSAKWEADELAKIYDNALVALAAIHEADVADGFEFLRWEGATALDGLLAQVGHWYEWAGRGRSLGVIDHAMAWVVENKPANDGCCVCWGDARPGNMVVGDDLSIAAVLDWEMAVLGPPEADLGWWLMFEEVAFEGFQMPRPDGVPDRTATIARYEALTGRSVQDIHYFEILAAFRLAVINVRLLELGAYGEMAEGWIVTQDDGQMIINDPFTRLLAAWLDRDVTGAPLTP